VGGGGGIDACSRSVWGPVVRLDTAVPGWRLEREGFCSVVVKRGAGLWEEICWKQDHLKGQGV